MASFGESLRGAIKTGLCNYLGDVAKGADWVGSIYPVNPGPAARAIRAPICDNGDPTDPNAGFSGGQCAGLLYDLYLTSPFAPEYENSNTIKRPVGPNRLGPISSFKVTNVVQTTGGQFPQWRWDYTFTDANGSVNGSAQFQQGDSPSPLVERDDGQPDNCGDAPYTPNPFPPGGEPIPITFTYTNNEGNEVNVSGDFNLYAPIIAPIFAPVGILYAPIDINLPDLVFKGTIELSPDFNIRFGPVGGDDSPGVPPSPPATPEDPTTSPDTDEDEDNERLLGIHVRATQVAIPNTTQIFNVEGPDLFVPRLASVFFRVRMGRIKSWYGPIDVKATSSWIPVPEGTFAIAYDVRQEPGWVTTETPVYGRLPN